MKKYAAGGWRDTGRKVGAIGRWWRGVTHLLAGVPCALLSLLITLSPLLAQEDPVKWSLHGVPERVTAGEWNEFEIKAVLEPGWHIYGLTQPPPPIATQIRVGPDGTARSRLARQPEPIKRYDEAFGMETEFFEEEVTFRVPFMVTVNEAGRRELVIALTYQPCTDRVCLPPIDKELTLALAVVPGVVEPEDEVAGGVVASGAGGGGEAGTDEIILPSISLGGAANGAKGAGTTGTPSADASAPTSATTAAPLEFGTFSAGEGWAGFLLLAALMGALTLLTPCVFPMIPITVSYFANRGATVGAGRVTAVGASAVAVTAGSGGAAGVEVVTGVAATGTATQRVRRGPTGRQVRDALLYGAGIVLAFSGLGLLLALIYGATGINRFATNPWINLLVAGIFIGFAFTLLGSWQIRLPWRLANLLHSRSGGGGLGGIIFMGIAFAITTFTCTVPFVGTLLVAAADGVWLRPVLGMLVFSTVLALPFVLLALFPAVLESLPKSGGWMGTLMVVLGLIELGAALKFLSNADLIWRWGVLHREVVLALWIALSVIAALYLLKQIRLPGDTEEGIGVGRMLAGGAFLAFALFLLPGLFGRHVGEIDAFLPPAVYPGTEGAVKASGGGGGEESLVWYSSYEEALSVAVSSGKPIFIDFTGYTCTNCRWMEANIFTRADVRERFQQYVLVRLYTDGRGEEYTKNQNMQRDRFGTVALPLYVVLTPQDEPIATFPGLTRDPQEFLRFLDTGLGRTTGLSPDLSAGGEHRGPTAVLGTRYRQLGGGSPDDAASAG